MSRIPKELSELIQKYFDKFDGGPPLFGMASDEATRKINDALESGLPIEVTLPPDGVVY